MNESKTKEKEKDSYKEKEKDSYKEKERDSYKEKERDSYKERDTYKEKDSYKDKEKDSYKINEDLPNGNIEISAGSLDYDIPSRITHAKMSSGEVMCQIEWKKRYDDTLPKRSYVTNKQLRKLYPLILLDYYESKIKIERSSD